MRRLAGVLVLSAALGGPFAPLDGQTDSGVAHTDPVADRGFLIAKATAAPRGHGHVTAFWPGFVVLAYGASERVTLSGGTLPWLLPAGTGLFFGSLRTTILATAYSGIAIGASGLFVFEEGGMTGGGWPFVTGTLGASAGSLTALVGVGTGATVLGDDLAGSVLLQAMGELALARGIKLIAEALYLGDDSEPVGGVGLRFFGDRGAFEVGWGMTLESGRTFHHPWAAISYGF